MMNNNIEYPNTDRAIQIVNRKPILSWMHTWTQDEREAKFFEFCSKFDLREDKLLHDDYQIFSHRLHWDEHPFVDLMSMITDAEQRLYYTLVFSFTNEHWGTLTHLMDKGVDATREHFKTNRHARSDLFQIYYPKGTNVKEWLLSGPLQAARALKGHLTNGKRYTMMGFAKILEAHFKSEQGFRSPLYPCKNAARYLAMACPHLVDPESVLYGGTGHFDGMFQIFGRDYNGKCKYVIDADGEFIPKNQKCIDWLKDMKQLCEHPSNPMERQKMLNVEDKSCLLWKSIAIAHDVKSPTKRIPYNWIFPDCFSLAKHPTGKVILNGHTTRHLWDKGSSKKNYDDGVLSFT